MKTRLWRDIPEVALEMRLKRLWIKQEMSVPVELGGGVIRHERELLYVLIDDDGIHTIYDGHGLSLTIKNHQHAINTIKGVLTDVDTH